MYLLRNVFEGLLLDFELGLEEGLGEFTLHGFLFPDMFIAPKTIDGNKENKETGKKQKAYGYINDGNAVYVSCLSHKKEIAAKIMQL